MTPRDKEVVTSNVGWINVPGQNITYNFTELLNNYTYYQFQVGHRKPQLYSSWKKQIFSSYVYYFGKQGEIIIYSLQLLSSNIFGIGPLF